MAKQTTVKAKIETFFGKPVSPALEYTFEFEELEKGDKIPEKEAPDADEILDLVNNKRKSNERQKRQAIVLKEAGYEKPVVGVDMEFTFKQMVAILMAGKNGKSEEVAKQMANANLGTNY